MAVSIVGLGSSVTTAFQAGATRNWPAGHQADDVAIVFLSATNAGNLAPTGGTWTEFSWSGAGVLKTNSGTTADNEEVRVFWKRATSGAEAGCQVGDASPDGNEFQRTSMIVIRGLPTTGEPLNAYNVAIDNSYSTTVTFPTLTTTSDDCAILYFLTNTIDTATAQFTGSLTNSDITSITQQVNTNSATGYGGGCLLVSAIKSTKGSIGAGSGYSLSTASPQVKIAMALGTPVTEKYFYGTSGASYILNGSNLINLTSGHKIRVKNMTNLMVNLETGKVMNKVSDNVLVDT